MDKPCLLVVVSDLHLNSTIGLPPGVRFPLDDGGAYRASIAQRWLWQCWQDFWVLVKKRGNGLPIYVVLNGDLVDGDHHQTRQIISRNHTTWERMASKVLEPVAQLSHRLFVVRGTTVHTGYSASVEEAIAEDLGAVLADVKTERYSWWWLPLKIGGVHFDIAHHTSIGRRPWTRGGGANRLAASTIFEYAERGEKPPNVVIRSHVHRAEDSYHTHSVRAIITPCWQLQTEYGSRIAAGQLPSIGGVIIACHGDRDYDVDMVLYQPRRRRAWVEPVP